MMRIISFLSVFVSLMLVVPCFASLPPVTDGLVGCWKFDEGSLVAAIDTSGNGNDGTMVNTTFSEDTPSLSLSTFSLRFNSTQSGNAYSYVTIPDSPSLRPNSSLTLTAWVKAGTYEGRMRHVISKQIGSGGGDSFVLWYHDDGNLWFDVGGVGHITTGQPPANEWHHIAATYDGSFMRLYVDGMEQASGARSGSIPYDNNSVLIGADDNNDDNIPDEGWDGLIDEVLIYGRALTQAEIAALTYSSKLYGIIGNHLVTIDQNTGNAAEVGLINATINANVFMGLTYDPYADALYSVANATTDPKLIVIDRITAEATLVGPIDLAGHDTDFLKFVEALAFNPVDSTLYGSAASAPSLSNLLIRIDPATGNATQIASISGTTENDGDTLVFVNGTLYLADSTPGSVLFTVNLSTGAATSVGSIGFNHVKLAYNPETQRFFGAASLNRLFIEISPTTGQGTLVGSTHTPEEFEGAYVHAMAVVFDRRPPDIDIPTQDPTADNVQPYQNVTISVSVTDNLSGIKNVTLVYSLDNTTTWEEPLTMNYNTTTGLYEAMISGQPIGTWVKYKIVACDQTGNNATLEGEQPYLAYQVIPEFQFVLALSLFLLATIIGVIAYTWRRRRQSHLSFS